MKVMTPWAADCSPTTWFSKSCMQDQGGYTILVPLIIEIGPGRNPKLSRSGVKYPQRMFSKSLDNDTLLRTRDRARKGFQEAAHPSRTLNMLTYSTNYSMAR